MNNFNQLSMFQAII